VSYRAGIGQGMQSLGLAPREPHLVCDGCGAIASCFTKRGDVAAWVLKRRPPRGWTGTRVEREDGTIERSDFCPKCAAERERGSA